MALYMAVLVSDISEKTTLYWMWTHKWCNNRSDQQGNDIRPNLQRDFLFGGNSNSENEASNKHDYIPPPWGLLVVLRHVVMVPIVKSACSGTIIGTADIFTPEQNTMSNQRTDCSICHEQRECKSPGEPRQAILFHRRLVENTARENLSYWI